MTNIHGRLAGGLAQGGDASEELQDHVSDVRPIVDKDGNEGAQVQEHIEEQSPALCAAQAEEILEQGQVSGAGDGQKFRHALDEAQEG